MTVLSKVAQLIMGQSPPSTTYNETGNGLPFYQGKVDFGFRYPTPRKFCSAPNRIAEPGDILISVRAPVGPTNVCAHRCCIGRGLGAIRPREIHGLFLYYNLRYIEPQITALGTGSTFRAINKSQLAGVPVNEHDFPRDEQETIAALLLRIEDSIERQERLITLTTELKEALIHRLFTEGTRGGPQKETEIGLLPANWELATLSTLIAGRLQNGAFIRRPVKGRGFLFANVVDMYREVYLNCGQLERIEVPEKEIDQYFLNEGDLLVVRSSLKREGVGQNCVAKNLPERVFYDCHLIRVVPNTDKVVPEFLSYFWRSSVGKADLIQRSKTTTMTTINQQSLGSALVPIPERSEQVQIVESLQSLDAKIAAHGTIRDSYYELFCTLLHQLMTAQVRMHNLDLSELGQEPVAGDIEEAI